MFNKYRVVIFTRNMSDGESNETIMLDTEKQAKDKFFDKCSQLGGNPQTKSVEVMIFNPSGDLIKIEKIDNSQYVEPMGEE